MTSLKHPRNRERDKERKKERRERTLNYLRVYDLKNAVEFIRMNSVVEEKTSIEKNCGEFKKKTYHEVESGGSHTESS